MPDIVVATNRPPPRTYDSTASATPGLTMISAGASTTLYLASWSAGVVLGIMSTCTLRRYRAA